MKYKIHYKASDKVHNLEPIIKFMESQGYKYDMYNHGHVLFIRPDFDDPSEEIYFEINLNNRTISKYIRSNKMDSWDISFTTEELKFFDIQDFEVVAFDGGELIQDIRDWIEDI